MHFGNWDAAHPAMYTILGVVESAQYWSPIEKDDAGAYPMYFLPAGQWAALAPTDQDLACEEKFLTNSH